MDEVNAIGRDHASVRTLILLVLILFVACDPEMSVRQVNSFVESKNAAAVTAIPKISIDVKTTHQLIGQGWYEPGVVATNSSDVPVTITSIELIAGSRTFKNEPTAKKNYPVHLPAHSSARLAVYFSFSDGMYVDKVFKNPANCEFIIQANRVTDSHASRSPVGL